LSRHRKVRLGRSKAIVIAAAGALSVATAASAAAATWSPGAQEHAAGSDGPAEITHEAAAAPGLAVTEIPQALPGSRMASAGPDWQTNAATQVRWGLTYIKDTYGSPCAAWAHSQATSWY
jgi:hypothetical protein